MSNAPERIVTEVSKAFVGNTKVIQKILIALLAGGHVLLEDIPGVGKTTLAVAFSRALGLSCNRIQFTPDTMPTDITGFTMLRQDSHAMEFQPGAVMCNLLLADEINRASTRSQSALLEAMEENAVTVDGKTHPLPQPFMVLATQNPAGSSGTQLLPESQTDRFMMRLSIGYPTEEAEKEMLLRKHGENPAQPVGNVTTAAEVLAMRQGVSRIYVADAVYDYILQLARRTRECEGIIQGASPRGTAALMALAQATAFICGRDYVVPQDVQAMFIPCIAHRLVLTGEAKRTGGAEKLLQDLLLSVKAPGLKVG